MATKKKKHSKEKETFIREYGFDAKLNITKLDVHQDPKGIWSGGIGATVWDAGIVLAKYFEANKLLIYNKSVLEIGSGTGLVGMICSKLGAKAVLFTDKDCAIPLLNKNLFENFYKHYAIQITKDKDKNDNEEKDEEKNDKALLLSKELTWGDVKQLDSLCNFMKKHYGKFDSMFDVIILSDCICWKELYEPLVQTLQSIVEFIAKNNKNKQIPSIIMSYEIRKDSEEQNFFQLLTEIHWTYKQIKLDSIHPMYLCDELVVWKITPMLQH